MGYSIPPGFSRVTFKYGAVASTGSRLVWGFGCDVEPGQLFTDEMADFWDDQIAPLTNNAYELQEVEARSDNLVSSTVVSNPGNVENAYVSPQVSALVKLVTGLPGRSNRGRIYLPGVLPEADVDQRGNISSARVGLLQLAMDNLATRLATVDGQFRILHSDVEAPTAVTSYVVQSVAATQRRRLRR